jgi:hypothetical protein
VDFTRGMRPGRGGRKVREGAPPAGCAARRERAVRESSAQKWPDAINAAPPVTGIG